MLVSPVGYDRGNWYNIVMLKVLKIILVIVGILIAVIGIIGVYYEIEENGVDFGIFSINKF
jgi:uncharacterized membrane protein YdbT with pleckstrin-like domain